MMNEEKAKKIVWNLFDDGLFYHKYESQRQEIQSALVNMAEWKDGQKEAEKEALINKACDLIAGNMKCTGYTFQTKVKFIKKFRDYMKGEMTMSKTSG